MIVRMGRLEYHPERGVLYVYDTETSECLLRVEGVRDVPRGHQIDIHLVEPGCEHHHEICGFRAQKPGMPPADPGMFCAVKLEAKEKNRC